MSRGRIGRQEREQVGLKQSRFECDRVILSKTRAHLNLLCEAGFHPIIINFKEILMVSQHVVDGVYVDTLSKN